MHVLNVWIASDSLTIVAGYMGKNTLPISQKNVVMTFVHCCAIYKSIKSWIRKSIHTSYLLIRDFI